MGRAKSSFFNACYAGNNQNISHACSGFNAQKVAYFALHWNVDVSDMDHFLVESTKLSKIDFSLRLEPKYEE